MELEAAYRHNCRVSDNGLVTVGLSATNGLPIPTSGSLSRLAATGGIVDRFTKN